jgi:hypothetical protein
MVATRATRFRMWIDSLSEAYPATGASLMGPSTPGRVDFTELLAVRRAAFGTTRLMRIGLRSSPTRRPLLALGGAH